MFGNGNWGPELYTAEIKFVRGVADHSFSDTQNTVDYRKQLMTVN
jgi:hypothetical protein